MSRRTPYYSFLRFNAIRSLYPVPSEISDFARLINSMSFVNEQMSYDYFDSEMNEECPILTSVDGTERVNPLFWKNPSNEIREKLREVREKMAGILKVVEPEAPIEPASDMKPLVIHNIGATGSIQSSIHQSMNVLGHIQCTALDTRLVQPVPWMDLNTFGTYELLNRLGYYTEEKVEGILKVDKQIVRADGDPQQLLAVYYLQPVIFISNLGKKLMIGARIFMDDGSDRFKEQIVEFAVFDSNFDFGEIEHPYVKRRRRLVAKRGLRDIERMKSKEEIQTELVKGGIEENPGPGDRIDEELCVIAPIGEEMKKILVFTKGIVNEATKEMVVLIDRKCVLDKFESERSKSKFFGSVVPDVSQQFRAAVTVYLGPSSRQQEYSIRINNVTRKYMIEDGWPARIEFRVRNGQEVIINSPGNMDCTVNWVASMKLITPGQVVLPAPMKVSSPVAVVKRGRQRKRQVRTQLPDLGLPAPIQPNRPQSRKGKNNKNSAFGPQKPQQTKVRQRNNKLWVPTDGEPEVKKITFQPTTYFNQRRNFDRVRVNVGQMMTNLERAQQDRERSRSRSQERKTVSLELKKMKFKSAELLDDENERRTLLGSDYDDFVKGKL